MIRVYCPDQFLAKQLHAVLDTRFETSWAKDWDELEKRNDDPDCAIVGLVWLSDGPELDRLILLRRRVPYWVVLVTSPDPANSRWLKDFTIDDLVWTTEVQSRLVAAARHASSASLLKRIAEAVRSENRLPKPGREALILALERPSPILKVSELAFLLGVHRTTLEWQWRQAVLSAGGPRLKRTLDSIALVRAVLKKSRSKTWAKVAEELEVEEGTLARISMRLTGGRLRPLEGVGPRELIERLPLSMLRPLIRNWPDYSNGVR